MIKVWLKICLGEGHLDLFSPSCLDKGGEKIAKTYKTNRMLGGMGVEEGGLYSWALPF